MWRLRLLTEVWTSEVILETLIWQHCVIINLHYMIEDECSPLNVLVNYGSLENPAQQFSCEYIVCLYKHGCVWVGGSVVYNNTTELILCLCLTLGQIYQYDSHSCSVKRTYFTVFIIFASLYNRARYCCFLRNGVDFWVVCFFFFK